MSENKKKKTTGPAPGGVPPEEAAPGPEAEATAPGGAPEPEKNPVCEPEEAPEEAPGDGPAREAEAPPAAEPGLEELKRQQQETMDRLLRTAAEFDNFRKRTEREKAAAVSLGTAAAAEKLLPVLDALELAAAADSADADYKKGVEMTVTLFVNALRALGIEEIEALGQPFNPALHNAVAREAGDGDEGTVLRVLQKGYRMGDRVIRHAMVAVAE